jgi:prepilin-type N-terminal cleavage/methylation domain-containing protein
MKKGRSFRGFTLMEMLIVVAIIAILAAIAIPTFTGSLEKARKATCAANRRSLKGLLTTAYMTDGADAVKSTYSDQKNKFTCPDGGTISYSLDSSTGTVTVFCSKHESENSVQIEVFKALYQQVSDSKATVITSSSVMQKGSAAYTWYNNLSAAQRAVLAQYYWSIQKNSGKTPGYRIFFTTTSASGKSKGVYKYSQDKNQYQYNPDTQMNSSASVTGGGSNWGAYVNGKFVQNAWADTMAEASGQ